MELEKAIELLTEGSEGNMTATWEDYSNAVKLGIEALKAINRLALSIHNINILRLPGETDETEEARPPQG